MDWRLEEKNKATENSRTDREHVLRFDLYRPKGVERGHERMIRYDADNLRHAVRCVYDVSFVSSVSE